MYRHFSIFLGAFETFALEAVDRKVERFFWGVEFFTYQLKGSTFKLVRYKGKFSKKYLNLKTKDFKMSPLLGSH